MTDNLEGKIKENKPPGYWINTENILNEAKQVLNEQNLTELPAADKLGKLGKTSLAWAINQNYPGGFPQLRKDLGEEIQTPYGYWTDPANIFNEAKQLIKENNFQELPPASIITKLNPSLSAAISKTYPHKYPGLRKDLGETILKKPAGYWHNPENTRQEMIKLIKDNNLDDVPNADYLKLLKRTDLIAGITRHYPGKFPQLRNDLGYQLKKKSISYWLNPENIRNEAKLLKDEHNLDILPQADQLIEMGRSDLASGISNHYEGGYIQLRLDLGEEERRKPNGYWKDPGKILTHAKTVLAENNLAKFPSQKELSKMGYSSLTRAITLHYPGKYPGLRRDLGETIESDQVDQTIENLINEYSKQ